MSGRARPTVFMGRGQNIRRYMLLVLALGFLSANSALNADFDARLLDAASSQIGVTVHYDGSYRHLKYPGGDVPLDTGVCADVVVRAYRKVGIDFQVLVHDDMAKAWSAYPHLWRLQAPDTNIDHRRVLNLATFLRRHDSALPISGNASDYRPGDLVTWTVAGSLPHIGIVSSDIVASRPLIIHNIGHGTQEEDILFAYPITGHYRYPKSPGAKL